VSGLVFTLRGEPEQRLDLSPLTPDRLKGLSLKEIAALELHTTKRRVTAGELFEIQEGDAADVRFEGGSERFDRIGHEMRSGSITIEGDAGLQAGRWMAGGVLNIKGNTGPWTGSGMKAGHIVISGNAGDWLGGPLPGELAGMRGGLVHVQGNVGREAGHRLRRGTIFIEGNAGPYAGRAMIAGTLLIGGRAGSLPGYLMRRGTIVLGQLPEELSPTFNYCGRFELVFAQLLSSELRDAKIRASAMLAKPLRRYAGDLAAGGKGEILLPV
jgi:formylmethanofuran dehydrogenase subunit C